MASPPEADGRVLSTLNEDGSRRKLRPRLSRGRFLRWRQMVGYALIVIFAVLPFVHIGGKPFFLLDIAARKFTIFGASFLATDTVVLMLFLVAVVIGLFLLTALFGRLWCGWACPQTVYLELIFRPIERWLEGNPAKQRRLDEEGGGWRRLAKNAVFFFVSALFSNVFVSYFVGGRALLGWVVGAPAAHPAAFIAMGLTTVLMFLDFAWYREQTCIVACPYGRLQSVLLDRHSVIVGYDEGRGEPRAKYRERRGPSPKVAAAGDCIDCQACLRCCPVGIDIRAGLQMECIGCTQCIDACDAIMDSLKQPRGLIRYASQAELAGAKKSFLRPRTIIYPGLLMGVILLLALAIGKKEDAEVRVLRGRGAPFTLLGAEVSNHMRITIVNRGRADERYRISLLSPPKVQLIVPINPLEVREGHSETTTAFAVAPRTAFTAGELRLRMRIEGEKSGLLKEASFKLLGPRTGSR